MNLLCFGLFCVFFVFWWFGDWRLCGVCSVALYFCWRVGVSLLLVGLFCWYECVCCVDLLLCVADGLVLVLWWWLPDVCVVTCSAGCWFAFDCFALVVGLVGLVGGWLLLGCVNSLFVFLLGRLGLLLV